MPSFGAADALGDNAPTFDLWVNDIPVTPGIRALIQSVEYESVDGVADVLKIVSADPYDGDGFRVISDAKIFAPGNEITVAYGYFGGTIENVGRALIRKVRPNFPGEGVPTIEITAYTKDVLMMDNEPAPIRERQKKTKRKKQVKVDEFGNEIEDDGMKDSKAGRRFANQIYSDAVTLIAQSYGFVADVDTTPDPPHDFIHKAGMKDYDFVKGLSNITGYYFWVDFDFDIHAWVLHFKNPETYVEPQDKEYNLKYAIGDFSTIIDFEPQMAIQDTTTELYVEVQDPQTGKVMSVKIEEPEGAAPDPIEIGDVGKLDSAYTTDLKIFLGEFSIEVRANRKFRDQNELQVWAQQWFRRQRENFVMASANTIGIENLRARQTHKISGVGTAYEGRYVFNRVRHIFSLSGYTCELSMRKKIEPISPNLRPLSEQEALLNDLDLLP